MIEVNRERLWHIKRYDSRIAWYEPWATSRFNASSRVLCGARAKCRRAGRCSGANRPKGVQGGCIAGFGRFAASARIQPWGISVPTPRRGSTVGFGRKHTGNRSVADQGKGDGPWASDGEGSPSSRGDCFQGGWSQCIPDSGVYRRRSDDRLVEIGAARTHLPCASARMDNMVCVSKITDEVWPSELRWPSQFPGVPSFCVGRKECGRGFGERAGHAYEEEKERPTFLIGENLDGPPVGEGKR